MMAYVEAPRAWALVRGMARSVGLDLVGAVNEGWMARADLGTLVETCETCDKAETCTAWLATHVTADSPPPFCHNRKGLEELMS